MTKNITLSDGSTFVIFSISAKRMNRILRKNQNLFGRPDIFSAVEDLTFLCTAFPYFESKDVLLNTLNPGQYAELSSEILKINGYETEDSKRMKVKLIDFQGTPPLRAHDNDAGADVFSPVEQIIFPGQVLKIPLGFGLELPDGCAGYIFPRSSLSAKGIVCELPPIDSGYRGEVHAILTNVGTAGYTIKKGDRIGQLVIMPVLIPEFTYQESAPRGHGAFGSSGR